MGDFNLPNINWNNFECPQDDIHDVLLDCFLTNCLCQYVKQPTREKNILDLVFCNDDLSILDVKVVGKFTELCDHHMVEFVLCCEPNLKTRDNSFRDFRRITQGLVISCPR